MFIIFSKCPLAMIPPVCCNLYFVPHHNRFGVVMITCTYFFSCTTCHKLGWLKFKYIQLSRRLLRKLLLTVGQPRSSQRRGILRFDSESDILIFLYRSGDTVKLFSTYMYYNSELIYCKFTPAIRKIDKELNKHLSRILDNPS